MPCPCLPTVRTSRRAGRVAASAHPTRGRRVPAAAVSTCPRRRWQGCTRRWVPAVGHDGEWGWSRHARRGRSCRGMVCLATIHTAGRGASRGRAAACHPLFPSDRGGLGRRPSHRRQRGFVGRERRRGQGLLPWSGARFQTIGARSREAMASSTAGINCSASHDAADGAQGGWSSAYSSCRPPWPSAALPAPRTTTAETKPVRDQGRHSETLVERSRSLARFHSLPYVQAPPTTACST